MNYDETQTDGNKFMTYIVAALITGIFLFNCFLNYEAFYAITKSVAWSICGLFTLDFAAVSWLFATFLCAKGSGQRFVCITASAITSILVMSCSGLKFYMMANEGEVAGGARAAMLLVLISAIVGNLAASWFYKFFDPKLQDSIEQQRTDDFLRMKSNALLRKKIEAFADVLSEDAAVQSFNRVAAGHTGHTGHTLPAARVNGHSFDGGLRSGLSDTEKTRLMKQRIEESEDDVNASLQAAQQSRWNSKDAGND